MVFFLRHSKKLRKHLTLPPFILLSCRDAPCIRFRIHLERCLLADYGVHPLWRRSLRITRGFFGNVIDLPTELFRKLLFPPHWRPPLNVTLLSVSVSVLVRRRSAVERYSWLDKGHMSQAETSIQLPRSGRLASSWSGALIDKHRFVSFNG